MDMDFKSIEDKFWSKVSKPLPTACWPWLGKRDRDGYGVVVFRERGKRRHTGAHRVALILSGTKLPPGIQACHSCDNPICCNPSHLFAGTNAGNHLDSKIKGRRKRARVFTDDDIIEIVRMRSSGATQLEIARKFRVRQSSISDVWMEKKRYSPGSRLRYPKIQH